VCWRPAAIGCFSRPTRASGGAHQPAGSRRAASPAPVAGCTPATRADTFPVRYRANTPERIERLAREAGPGRTQVRLVGDPTYLAFNRCAVCAGVASRTRHALGLRVHIVGDYQKSG